MSKTIGEQTEGAKASDAAQPLPEWLEIVRNKVAGLSYGVVQIIVHDRKITQIERTERTRLDPPAPETLKRRENY